MWYIWGPPADICGAQYLSHQGQPQWPSRMPSVSHAQTLHRRVSWRRKP